MKNRLLFLAAAVALLAAGCKQSTNVNENAAIETNNAAVETNANQTGQSIQSSVTNAWRKTKEATTNAAVQAWTDVKDTFSSTADYGYDKKTEYVNQAQADLSALDQKMQDLTNRVATASDSVQADAQVKLQDLRAKRATLDQKLDDVKNATQDNWNDAKTAFRNSYDDLKTSVKQAWQWLNEQLKS